jgi:peptidoglycan hydrolase-like protein with peptidoglycan-binding domain
VVELIIDFAWGRPGVTALKKAGVTGVIRYASHDTTGKNLQAAEARSYLTAGVDVALVWESTARRTESGRAGGIDDAKAALSQAIACGMPSGRPIYFACDYDAPGTAPFRYLEGVASVIGLHRVGLYAGYRPIKAAFDSKLITFGWQTYAWSSGAWDYRSQLQQYSNGHVINGVGVDYDRVPVRAVPITDWGGWLQHATPAPTAPPADPIVRLTAPAFSGRIMKFPPITIGAEVRAWQGQMKRRGWKITVDGAYGRVSRLICVAFQKEKHLHADGEVGRDTWKATWTSPV